MLRHAVSTNQNQGYEHSTHNHVQSIYDLHFFFTIWIFFLFYNMLHRTNTAKTTCFFYLISSNMYPKHSLHLITQLYLNFFFTILINAAQWRADRSHLGESDQEMLRMYKLSERHSPLFRSCDFLRITSNQRQASNCVWFIHIVTNITFLFFHFLKQFWLSISWDDAKSRRTLPTFPMIMGQSRGKRNI